MRAFLKACLAIDQGLGQALQTRQLDVFAAHHLEHGGSRQPHVRGGEEPAERERGHDQVRHRAGARGRQPPEVDGEEQDHHEADPEGGEREPEQREDLPDPVPPAVDAHGGEDAGGDADQERQGHGGRGEHERVGQPREVELEDGRAVVEGLAEVPPHERRDEVSVLDEERAVEAELLADLLEVRLARAGLDEEHRRVARHADEEEDGDREQHERDHRVAQPANDVFSHLTTPCGSSSAPSHRFSSERSSSTT